MVKNTLPVLPLRDIVVFPDAVPVNAPTNVVAVTTPDMTCGPPTI